MISNESIGMIIPKNTNEKLAISQKNVEPLGIPSLGYEYLRLAPGQNRNAELNATLGFMIRLIQNEVIPQFKGEEKLLQFINYGDTELVYVLTVDGNKCAILISQPHTKLGVVKKEYDNLITLKNRFPDYIVAPFYYSKDDKTDKELYVAPYLYQARCVGVCKHDWGEWVPEPDYYFREYPENQRIIINSCMIGLLIKFYDSEKGLGLGACKIGGGDFMLEKGYENEDITQENILKRMKLIAAREFIPISLDEYINKIRAEFCQRTYYQTEADRDKSILINYKSMSPILLKDIQKGIDLGLALRDAQKTK